MSLEGQVRQNTTRQGLLVRPRVRLSSWEETANRFQARAWCSGRTDRVAVQKIRWEGGNAGSLRPHSQWLSDAM